MARMRVINEGRVRLSCAFVLLATSFVTVVSGQYPSVPQITKDGTAILLEDFASLPLSSVTTSTYPSPINFQDQLGRVNYFLSEPIKTLQSSRFFVIDMNGTLYMLDNATKKITPYLKFAEIFPKFTSGRSFTSGLISLAFDPAYAKNGKFYTVHTEDPGRSGSAAPVDTHLPRLNLNEYKTTPAENAPVGTINFESVLMEWTDNDIRNSTFEGTAREILRVGSNNVTHPMDDLLFNPLARPGHYDYGNLYISVGDGRAGEAPGIIHTIPQRLDALQGKILRITPDITLHPKDLLGSNGRYRIPSIGSDRNPYVSVRGARGEIYALGFRNPQRMSWDPITNTLIVDDIGLHSWEEVDIVVKGGNYGYAEREGPEQLFVGGPNDGKTGSQINPKISFPAADTLTVDLIDKPFTPIYPAAVYSHRDGDSIGNGFVYRGKVLPQLVGKYIFTDLPTGRMFYTDLVEMIAAGGIQNKAAEVHEIQIMYKSPYDTLDKTAVKRRIYDIVADAFTHKEGVGLKNTVLPSASASVGGFRDGVMRENKFDTYGVPYGGGRADVRLAVDGNGELYVLSKSDGMIRKLEGMVTPRPASRQATGR
jgi:hypothetical protein